MKQASDHYTKDGGKTYAEGRFGDRMQFGRLYQTRYYRSYCRDDQVMLDFGCATGLALRNLPAVRRIGVEVNPHSVAECRRLCEQESVPIELHDSLDPVADASVDLVISNHCLEHVPNPLMVLGEMHRVLKPGGRLVMVLPFDDFRRTRHDAWRPGDKDNHLYTWSPLNIGNLATEAGFAVQQSKVISGSWSPKIFWVHRVFGHRGFALACRMLSWLRNSREVFIEAVKA